MLFNSYIFLLAFLPVTLAIFHLLRFWSYQAALQSLMLMSVVFYAYWKPEWTYLLVGSVLATWFLARMVENTRPATAALVFGLVFNLGLLAWFKYSVFFMTIGGMDRETAKRFGSTILPLAISFYTFQKVGFLVDVYRGDLRTPTLSRIFFVVFFFPHLIAGPIVRIKDVDRQIDRLRGKRGIFIASLVPGLFFFSIGLAKKVILADSLAPYANSVFDYVNRGYSVGVVDAWIGALAYSLQLYFDFSGYSDMAIGLARLFGFVLPVNFFSPYKARSIIDFWRRWHISLSQFFRDYVYIPLGGNRCGRARQAGNLMFVMALTGLWHGAGWTFVLWGMFHGVLLLINHTWHWTFTEAGESAHRVRHLIARMGRWMIHPVLAQAVTLFCVVVGWVLFRAETYQTAWHILRGMLYLNGVGRPLALIDMNLYPVAIALIGLLGCVALCFPNSVQFVNSTRHMDRSIRRLHLATYDLFGGRLRAGLTLPNAILVALLLYFAVTGIMNLNTQFLYFNF